MAASSDDGRAPRSRSPGEGGGDSRLGLLSKYKPFLNRDKNFSKFVVSTRVSC